jgi:hypothetical protein
MAGDWSAIEPTHSGSWGGPSLSVTRGALDRYPSPVENLPCQDVALELPGRGEGEVVENLNLFGELICHAALSEEVKDLNEEEAGPCSRDDGEAVALAEAHVWHPQLRPRGRQN